MSIDPNHPYNALPYLPPSRAIETPAIFKACLRATRALAEMNGVAQSLPDPKILLIVLPLQEAKDSSAIENIITTTNNLFRALALNSKNNTDLRTKEVLRYRQAMEVGENLLKGNEFLLTTNLFEKICSTLLGVEMRVRAVPGVRLENTQTKQTIYTPPEGDDLLRNLLGNLEKFINEDTQLDPLIKMAVLHYQFEAIHPFSDGNGRTGRILNILYLMQQKRLDLPILYLSRYFIEKREDYYQKLSQVTYADEWEEWILYMLIALEKTSYQTSKKIGEIRDLFNKKLEEAKIKAPNMHIKEMTEVVFIRPYVRIAEVAVQLKVSRLTATKYLKKWEQEKLLSSTKIGRDLLFINHDLLALFSEEGEENS